MLSKIVFFAIEFGFIPDCQRWENPCRNPCTASVYPTLEGLSASGGPRPSMCFPHTTSSRVPARMITSETRIILQKHTFKNTSLRQTGFLCPNFRNLGQFEAKCFIDNTIFIWYLNFGCLKPIGVCCRISSNTICCYSSPAITQP